MTPIWPAVSSEMKARKSSAVFPSGVVTGNTTMMARRDDRRRTLSLAMPAHALRRALISSLICE